MGECRSRSKTPKTENVWKEKNSESPSGSRKIGKHAKKPDLTALSVAPIFRDLSSEDRKALAEIAALRNFRRNEIIFHQGTPSAGFHFIHSGSVCVHRLSPNGEERVIRIFLAGESFAEASLLPGGVYPATARATEPCQIFFIPKTPFLSLLAHDPGFALRVIISLSVRLHSLADVVETLRIADTKERLLRWLIARRPHAVESVSYTVTLPTSKSLLAGELGMRNETLSRHLTSLKQSNILKVNGREIVVCDTQRIRTLLEEKKS